MKVGNTDKGFLNFLWSDFVVIQDIQDSLGLVEDGVEDLVNHKDFLKEKYSRAEAASVKELKTYRCFYRPI